MKDGNRGWLLDLAVAALLGAGAFAVYTLTLAPTVLAGDGGEFQFVPYLLGVAHPTGYPLYSLLGWAWSHLLPVGDVAYRLNLFSAFWAALAVGLLYFTASALLRQAIPGLSPAMRRLIAALAAATFAVTPTLWSQAIIAEVYGLNIFLVVALFYLLLTWGERQNPRLLLLAALCFGLGLAHHSTTILLAPAILAYVWLTDRRVFSNWRLLLKALLLVLLPMALYLYIPWRAPQTPYLELPLTEGRELVLYENTLASLVNFVLGGPFGGSVDLSVDLGQRLTMTGALLIDEVGWLVLALALAGVVSLVIRRCWALLALTGLAYLVTVAFNLVYTIGDIFVLYIPSYLVIVLWLTVGVGTLVQVLAKAWSRFSDRDGAEPQAERAQAGRSGALAAIVLVSLLFLVPLRLAVTGYADVDQSRNTRARERWTAILAQPLPPEAILVSNDRNNIMPMWYFQYVDGKRPDLLGLFPLITADYPTLGTILDLALGTGRPVYLIKEMPGVEVKAEVEAETEGGLWRVLGPAVEGEPAYPRDVRLEDAVALADYDRSPRSPQPGGTLEVRLYWEALRPLEAEYHTFVHLLDAQGQVVAQSDRQPGGVYYPTTLWRPGERLRDDHLLRIPSDAPVGVYRLMAGMYTLSGDGLLEPLGEPVVLGPVGVKTDVRTTPGEIGQPASASFAGQMELLSYDAALEDGLLRVTLHWRCLQPPKADYTVFVHLLDAQGQTVAQHDGQPQGGAYPTSICDVGEVIVDEHLLPADALADEHHLRVGLYLLETGERLPVEGGGDSVELGPLKAGD